ncbi:MAG: hypothetical protein ACQKBY_11200 [Verrucomicrobiales bacterium]
MKPLCALATTVSLLCAAPLSAAIYLIDFSGSGGTPSSPDTNGNHWNSLATANSSTLSSLADTGGTSEAISITTSGFGGNSSAGTITAHPSLGNLGISSALVDWFHVNSGGTGTVTISGLDDSLTYTLDLFGSRPIDTTRITTYTIGGVSQKQTSAGVNSGTGSGSGTNRNDDDLTTFANISPTSGVITFTVRNTDTADFSYINAMRLTSVPEPSHGALIVGCFLLIACKRRRNG